MIRLFLAFLAFSVLSSCAIGGTADSNQSLPIPDATNSITPGDLRIGPMDTLQVDVFGVEELGGIYQVDFEGQLKMPLVGEVQAVGLTASELSFVLEKLYDDRYLQDPNVNVTIQDSIGRRITVDGSVASPGLYPVTGEISLLQAVALAGGPTDGANPRKVAVFRQINGERHGAAFNLEAIREGKAEDPQIYGNDIIVMDGSEARRTYGDVLRSMPLLALFLAL